MNKMQKVISQDVTVVANPTDKQYWCKMYTLECGHVEKRIEPSGDKGLEMAPKVKCYQCCPKAK